MLFARYRSLPWLQVGFILMGVTALQIDRWTVAVVRHRGRNTTYTVDMSFTVRKEKFLSFASLGKQMIDIMELHEDQ